MNSVVFMGAGKQANKSLDEPITESRSDMRVTDTQL